MPSDEITISREDAKLIATDYYSGLPEDRRAAEPAIKRIVDWSDEVESSTETENRDGNED